MNHPEDDAVHMQNNGGITAHLMEDWVKIVWEEHPPSLLVFDAFVLSDEQKLNLRGRTVSCL
jgi:hypothetical protein